MASMNSVDLSGYAEEIVRAASRAPSLHNAQPWLFRVGAAEVEVWADLRRRIPVADPDDRQLFIGVGAAVYGVRLAFGHLGLRTMVIARVRSSPR
jgi:nitroreductase